MLIVITLQGSGHTYIRSSGKFLCHTVKNLSRMLCAKFDGNLVAVFNKTFWPTFLLTRHIYDNGFTAKLA